MTITGRPGWEAHPGRRRGALHGWGTWAPGGRRGRADGEGSTVNPGSNSQKSSTRKSGSLDAGGVGEGGARLVLPLDALALRARETDRPDRESGAFSGVDGDDAGDTPRSGASTPPPEKDRVAGECV
ncbi:hypothetical protein T492DRAFT_342399 [Pavlovales sp. CCMP2436]|nr:hypothetical protein T492DRAFT_342399 [Pavlovales sp. CCMP2436]